MRTRLIWNAVIGREKIHPLLSIACFHAKTKYNLAWICIQVVNGDNRVPTPVVSHCKNLGFFGLQDLEISPADLGDFLTHPDHTFHPVQQRVWIAPLFSHIHMLISICAPANYLQDTFVVS